MELQKAPELWSNPGGLGADARGALTDHGGWTPHITVSTSIGDPLYRLDKGDDNDDDFEEGGGRGRLLI